DIAPSHVQAFPFTAGGDRVAIGVTTLDAMFDEHPLCEPLLVKIDVQGVEDRVIAGGQETLRRTAVAIVEMSFETLYEGQPLFDTVYGMMKELGFSYRGNLGQLASPEDGRLLQCDAVFVRGP